MAWALAALVAALVTGLALYVLVPLSATAQGRYVAAAFDKRALLAAPRDRGAVLIFGGSTVAFSVSAQAIEQALETPVRNLGLQASLALMPLGMYAPHFRPQDDVLVLVIDPATTGAVDDVSLSQCDLVFLHKTLSAVRNSLRCLPVVLWHQLLDIRYRLFPPAPSDSVYQRRHFNAQGDMIGHLGRRASVLNPLHGSAAVADDRVESFIRQIEATTSGMRRIVLPPPAAEGFCATQRAALQQLLERVHAALDTSGHPLAPLFCADDTLFFDGWWHLGDEGRQQYTAYVSAALAERLSGGL